jgi:hypothetical protein
LDNFLNITPNVEILGLEFEEFFAVFLDFAFVHLNGLIFEMALDDVLWVLSFSENILVLLSIHSSLLTRIESS